MIIILTELQKNIAVRMLVGTTLKSIADEFHISLREISNWLRSSEFLEYKNSLSEKCREQVVQYLQSKQMKYVKRLENLSEQGVDLKVSRQATVDVLGYSGMENKNAAPPIISNINTNNVNGDKSQGDIDNEIDEIDDMIDDLEIKKKDEE